MPNVGSSSNRSPILSGHGPLHQIERFARIVDSFLTSKSGRHPCLVQPAQRAVAGPRPASVFSGHLSLHLWTFHGFSAEPGANPSRMPASSSTALTENCVT